MRWTPHPTRPGFYGWLSEHDHALDCSSAWLVIYASPVPQLSEKGVQARLWVFPYAVDLNDIFNHRQDGKLSEMECRYSENHVNEVFAWAKDKVMTPMDHLLDLLK